MSYFNIKHKIYFTFDLDWAPNYILRDTIDLIRSVEIPFTFFCTNQSSELKKIEPSESKIKHLSELSIHPNFYSALFSTVKNNYVYEKTLSPGEKKNRKTLSPGEQKNRVITLFDEQITDMLKQFPNAHGIRNHFLFQASNLLLLFKQKGFDYVSNTVRFLDSEIIPEYQWTGLVNFPIFFEDDIFAYLYPNLKNFNIEQFNLNSKGIKVFSFHPIHLYLNTCSMKQYEKAKPFLKEQTQLEQNINQKYFGIRDLFKKLISYGKKHDLIATETIGDFVKKIKHKLG